MKSIENKGVLILLGKNPETQDATKSTSMEASVLAKLAEDVIAWNRPLTPNEVAEGTRPAQVASLFEFIAGLQD